MAAGKRTHARSAARRPIAHSGERLLFAEEMLRNALEVMRELGLSRQERAEAYERAQGNRGQAPGAAKRYLDRVHGLGDLLSQWQSKAPFIDEKRTPRVLPIRGRGATLESLAKRCVPGMPLGEVVRAITRLSDVKRVKRNKVALLGTIFLRIPKSPDYTMASVTLGCQRYARTILLNAKRAEGRGHFERSAAQRLTGQGFARWLKRDVPRLMQQVFETEASLARAAKAVRGNPAGVTTFAWQDPPRRKAR